ncbi:UNVERIFIED_CONTAM: hypothetical protein K2H54_022322 [Gekko kuhli]
MVQNGFSFTYPLGDPTQQVNMMKHAVDKIVHALNSLVNVIWLGQIRQLLHILAPNLTGPKFSVFELVLQVSENQVAHRIAQLSIEHLDDGSKTPTGLIQVLVASAEAVAEQVLQEEHGQREGLSGQEVRRELREQLQEVAVPRVELLTAQGCHAGKTRVAIAPVAPTAWQRKCQSVFE